LGQPLTEVSVCSNELSVWNETADHYFCRRIAISEASKPHSGAVCPMYTISSENQNFTVNTELEDGAKI